MDERHALLTILLAHSEPEGRSLVMAALERCDVRHEVRIIHDGAELDELLPQRRLSRLPEGAPSPGLILADASFLRAQGQRLQELIAADPALQGLPVAVLTGSGSESGEDLPDSVHRVADRDLSGSRLEWVLRYAAERDRRIRAEARTRERTKELRTLYRATELLNRRHPPFEERLHALIGLLASGWRWPELTQVRLTLGRGVFQTQGFRETPWMQETCIAHEGGDIRLQVALTREPPEGEPAFLPEERELLENLGRALADVVARESMERLLQLTFAGMREALLVIDASHEARGIRYVNPAAEEMFGYEVGELLGGDTRRLHVDEDHFHRFGLESKKALEAEGVYFGTFPLRRKDGSVFQAEQTVSLLDPKLGHDAGAVSVIRDVSEQKRMDQQIRAMQKMESVGQLAGGIAHDFNNLLTVIRAQTDLILMDLPPGQASEDIALIQATTDRAAILTGQLLAFSREQVLQPRPVDLSDAVREFGGLIHPVVGEQIRIEHRLSDQLPTVQLDVHQLEQIVLNLALNARDAMPRGGTFTISTFSEAMRPDEAETLGMEPGRCAALAISDTGEGMSEAVLARVFDPFFTTKPKGKGTGLGLAMVYGTVKQSGGSITVESTPGRGSTFVLRFPAVDAEPEDPGATEETAGEPDSGPGPATILVIEDDATVRRMISAVLTREGFDVREAETAERGLEALESIQGLDLVLTDLVLPGRSGLALMEELAESRPELPLIMMSGYALGAFEKPVELPPGAIFLRKPFRPDELTEAIGAALRGG